MRRVFASAIFACLLAITCGARADESQTPSATPAPPVGRPTSRNASNSPTDASRAQTEPKAQVSPVAVTAKRVHARLDLKLSPNSLSRVLDESGVEPVAETETPVDSVEVTARRIQLEPIAQGIPALYYGIMHPSEAWRIFAPIQP
jgi:hypothetical protein